MTGKVNAEQAPVLAFLRASQDRLVKTQSDLNDVLAKPGPRVVVTINLHYFYCYLTDSDVRHVTDAAACWTADGFPIAQMLRRNGVRASRATGSHLAAALLESDQLPSVRSVMVLGSTAKAVDKYEAGLRRAGRQMVHRETRPVADWDLEAIRDRLVQADLVLIALGVEAGARVTRAIRAELASPLVVIGAGVGMAVGEERRAPEWVQRARVEWLWRLGLDPKRLWRRYLMQSTVAYLALRSASRQLSRDARASRVQ